PPTPCRRPLRQGNARAELKEYEAASFHDVSRCQPRFAGPARSRSREKGDRIGHRGHGPPAPAAPWPTPWARPRPCHGGLLEPHKFHRPKRPRRTRPSHKKTHFVLPELPKKDRL